MDVEWIVLADAAETVNNRLYLIGGGWTTLTINGKLPLIHPCAVAVAFSVPWSEANQQHNVEIAIEEEDGTGLAKVEGHVEVGRPPGTPIGAGQRVQMAIQLALPLQRLGAHSVIARVDRQEAGRASFYVVAGPAFASS